LNQPEIDRLADVLPALDELDGKTMLLAYLYKELGEDPVRFLLDQHLESKERLVEMADEFELMEMSELAAIVLEHADGALSENDPSRCPYTDEAGRRAWAAKMQRRREHGA
jgi:hypothetical protein